MEPTKISSLLETIILVFASFLTGGVGVAVSNGIIHRRKEQTETEATRIGTSIEVARLWMVGNDKLHELNQRLDLQIKETRELRRALVLLIDAVERFMNTGDPTHVETVLDRARVVSNGDRP